MTVIAVPDARARELLGDLDGTKVIVWDGRTEAPPAGLADVEFLVPPYPGGAPLAREAMALLPKLAVVQLLSAGYEGWPQILPPGVQLCNGRGVHGSTTAELAVSLLLALVRDLPRFSEQQAAHVWSAGEVDSLAGSRVMVIGAGDIGRRIADALRPLDVEVTLVGRTARDGVLSLQQARALLPEQRAVVLAVPLSPETTGLVDREFLAALTDGTIVVNVGRGASVVTADLCAELATGRLRAGLDVLDPEPPPAEHPVWTTPNLLLTPHVGGGARGWDQRAYRLVREQVGRLRAGQPLVNVVDTRT